MAALVANLRFFKTFLKAPLQVGALFPSSPILAKKITDPIDYAKADLIVEFGPGTGVFTKILLERKRKETKFVAFEINPQMADYVAENFPEVELVRGSADLLPGYLKEKGYGKVDAVVSGLPFANFPTAVQTKILDGVASSLKPEGMFLAFTYYHSSMTSPTTHRYRAKLKKTFSRVERIPVMKNIPPAYVMRCER